MVRTMVMGITLCSGCSLVGSFARSMFYVSILNGSIIIGLLVAVGLSFWVLRYPVANNEAWFLLFWASLGLVLGVSI